jgi:vacuolar-type H+-ATPase subunit C/Vma6
MKNYKLHSSGYSDTRDVTDMHNTLDAIKQDLSSNLSRQVRALVQQINNEAQGKCV